LAREVLRGLAEELEAVGNGTVAKLLGWTAPRHRVPELVL
jgi:hypothetical protein